MGNSRPSTSPSAGRADAAPALRRHDASLYIVASGLGGLGLGIALFYLNFLYRALGALASFAAIAIAGALAAPVGAAIGRAETDPLTIRTVIGIGGVLAIASAVPILFVRPATVAVGALDAPHRRSLLLRFMAIEMAFGFGAGSFLPFANLFFADRFGLPLAGVGLAIGALSVAGSVGAILNGRLIVPRVPPLVAIVLPVLASLPFALLAAVAGQPLLAWGALALRAALMYGSTPNFTALELSSFAPIERAGAVAIFAISWNGASAAGAARSGVA